MGGVWQSAAETMANDPDPDWERFAVREPYFAVLTAPEFLRRNLTPERQRAFFESGDALVASMFRAIELQLSPYFNPSAILEYGCGAGRLAIPLARRAARNAGSVTAVDRSPAMLDAARREAREHGVSNVEFRTPADLFAGSQTFDFITCYFVLQRLPPDEGLRLLAGLLDRLTPKGVGVFHVPFRSTAPAAVKTLRWIRGVVPGANAIVNMTRRRPAGEPFVRMYTYDLARGLRSPRGRWDRDDACRVRAARRARDRACCTSRSRPNDPAAVRRTAAGVRLTSPSSCRRRRSRS